MIVHSQLRSLLYPLGYPGLTSKSLCDSVYSGVSFMSPPHEPGMKSTGQKASSVSTSKILKSKEATRFVGNATESIHWQNWPWWFVPVQSQENKAGPGTQRPLLHLVFPAQGFPGNKKMTRLFCAVLAAGQTLKKKGHKGSKWIFAIGLLLRFRKLFSQWILLFLFLAHLKIFQRCCTSRGIHGHSCLQLNQCTWTRSRCPLHSFSVRS